jgi:hypothetical protein
MNVTEDDPPVRFFAVRKYATGAAVESPETQNFTLQAQKSRRNQVVAPDPQRRRVSSWRDHPPARPGDPRAACAGRNWEWAACSAAATLECR